MKKISVKELVEFRRKSDRGKKTFVENIKSNKLEVPTEGGGDYWISGLSAIYKSYRYNELDVINEKIEELQEKISNTKQTITRNMYQRNIALLEKYKTLNLTKLRPTENLSFLKKSTGNSLLSIKGLQIKTNPSHIFSFGKTGEGKIGAIWFVSKINGYRTEEISLFCDTLHRFLKHNYSKEYQLASKYCIVVDLLSGQELTYFEIEGGPLSQVLASTLDEINKLM